MAIETILFVLVVSLMILEALRKSMVVTSSKVSLRSRASVNSKQAKIPYELPGLKFKTSSRMAMGLKRLDDCNWLTIDNNYLPEHSLRQRLLGTSRENVIQCLPPSIIACQEVLEITASFLSSRFPQHFTITQTVQGPYIHNGLVGETYPIGSQCQNPLEVAALLSMEDFNILMRNSDTGEYHLQASATMFPAGWKLQERIGGSMACLHAPVPRWSEKLGSHVNRYFDHLNTKTAMERTSLFIQTTPTYFQNEPEVMPDPENPSALPQVLASDIIIRRERQTFTRLPKSNAVLFTVRTYMRPLLELGDEELHALRSHIWGWEEDIRSYKGWALWGAAVDEWCNVRLGPKDHKVKVMKGGCPF